MSDANPADESRDGNFDSQLASYVRAASEHVRLDRVAGLSKSVLGFSAAAGAAVSMTPAAEAAIRYSGVINQTLSLSTDAQLPWRSYSQEAAPSSLRDYVRITNPYGSAIANFGLGIRYAPNYGGFGVVEFGTVGAIYNSCNSACGFTDPNAQLIGGPDPSSPQRAFPVPETDAIGPAAAGFFNPLPIPGNDDRVIFKATYGYPHGPFGWIDPNATSRPGTAFSDGFFAGFRFRSDEASTDYNYGWIRIAIRTDPIGRNGTIGAEVPDGYPMEVRVIDWAYEVDPNAAIAAGDIGPAITPVEGDYNNDGVVDAADYTVWRDNLGGSGLPNDPTPDTINEADYDLWAANYGAVAAAAGSGQGVPEPGAVSLGLLALGAAGINAHRRRCGAA